MLMEIGDSEGQVIWMENPTISWDLSLAVQIIRQDLKQNSLLMPKNGILQNQIKSLDREGSLKGPDLLDKYAAIMVLAAVIAERGLLRDRIEKIENPIRWGNHDLGLGGPRGTDNGWMVM